MHDYRLLTYCMWYNEDFFFALHSAILHRDNLWAPPFCPDVPTRQSAVTAVLEEQYQAVEL